MGTMVWCLIVSLLLLSVNGELHDNVSQSFYEKPESSSPAPTNKLAGMKELVLYLTPDQVKVLESVGAIVRPFPQFEHAFLQQQSQQSVEEHTESQYQPISSEADLKQGMDLDEFYKVFNIQQLNEDLTVLPQTAEQITEKPRPKYKYNPKTRHQIYSAMYVPKKNNKTKSYSTEYVRFLPNYETEDLKMSPYHAQPLPGYHFQDAQANIFQNYFQTELSQVQTLEILKKQQEVQRLEDIQKNIEVQRHEEVRGPLEIQKLENIQRPVEVQKHEEVHRPEEIQKSENIRSSIEIPRQEKIRRPVEIQKHEEVFRNEDIRKPLDIQSHEKTRRPVIVQKHEEVQRNEDIRKPTEIPRYEKIRRPIEIQKHIEAQRPDEIYKPKENRRPLIIPRREKMQRPIEIQKLEEVQSPTDVQRNEEIRRPVLIPRHEKNRRPIEIQKHEEVSRPEDVQRNEEIRIPVQIERHEKNRRPIEIQKLEEVQQSEHVHRNEEVRKPLLIQKHEKERRPLEIQKHEEVQHPEDIQRIEEIRKSLLNQNYEKNRRPLEIQKHEEIQRPTETQPFSNVSTRTLTITRAEPQQPIDSIVHIQSAENYNKPNTLMRTATEPTKLWLSTKVQQTFDTIQKPLETQAPLSPDKTDFLMEQQVETPLVSTPPLPVPTSIVLRQFSSLLAPLIQHEKITESISQQKELVNNEQAIQTKLRQIKESRSYDEEKYAIELDKLNNNLGKQNALAEKLALETISKKFEPQVFIKDIAFKRRRPTEFVKHVDVPVTSPVLVRIPAPLQLSVPRAYHVPLKTPSLPVPVLQPEKNQALQPVPIEVEKQIPAPMARNVYVKVEHPYLSQKIVPVEYKHELPVKYPIHHSDKLTVIRHIWEH